jgi:hypothetical protein
MPFPAIHICQQSYISNLKQSVCYQFSSLSPNHHMTNHPSQQKGKAAVPKPARGLGLNPSGLPAADQLNIPAEQPSVSAFGFNPHKESMQQSGGPGKWLIQLQVLTTNKPKKSDQHSFRGLTQYDDSYTSSSTSFGASQSGGAGKWLIQSQVLTTNKPKNQISTLSMDSRKMTTHSHPALRHSAPVKVGV